MKKRRNDTVQIEGQMNLLEMYYALEVSMGCDSCVCKRCLYWWSDRCPYGRCYDDLRAEDDPYPKAHPGEPPRKFWSDWQKPGEQEHWCRGGVFYASYWCWHYVRYTGQQVRTCMECNVSVFQDGYIQCSYPPGCEECYQRFEERMKQEELKE